ncbi:uncharacterized protein DUF1554 [Bacteriovorax stolpii]|nr:DUF1554 domain-containing protein [Bacteriovorax stolpii]TDP51151.1 uncharacterized protein DUF1554 [Bacteriovorax stolpii]
MKFSHILTLTFFLTLLSCGQSDGVAPGAGSSSTPLKLFVTSSTTTGNIGGIVAADSLCMADSNYPGSGVYKALIVDGSNRVACSSANCSGGSSEHVDWVLRANTQYQRVSDGATVGTTNANGIFSFPLTNSLDASYTYWLFTGLTANWITNTGDCTNWSSTGGFGGFGLGDKTTIEAVYSNNGSCSTSVKLICVEQ